jgi:hypothetical protein
VFLLGRRPRGARRGRCSVVTSAKGRNLTLRLGQLCPQVVHLRLVLGGGLAQRVSLSSQAGNRFVRL